nr:MAG TPA: hypothetical protein [Caudoviricetes sp.]DAL61093.1 MAG TPA_asm: hypothetical protein [Caudoviricetes sp.]
MPVVTLCVIISSNYMKGIDCGNVNHRSNSIIYRYLA